MSIRDARARMSLGELLDWARDFSRPAQRRRLFRLQESLLQNPGMSLTDRIAVLAAPGEHFPLDTRLRRHQFADVYAAFTPRGYRMSPHRSGNVVAIHPNFGPGILIVGDLYEGNIQACLIARTLYPARQLAEHTLMRMLPSHRGTGLAVFLLMKGFDYFDRIGIRWVVAHAALESGRWYWARCGFGFFDPTQHQRVDGWASAVLGALGLPYTTAAFTRPGEYASLGSVQQATVSLRMVENALPHNPSGLSYLDIATGNGLTMDEQVELGRAIMITGPDWWGRLDLQGPDRSVFNAWVYSRFSKLARHM